MAGRALPTEFPETVTLDWLRPYLSEHILRTIEGRNPFLTIKYYPELAIPPEVQKRSAHCEALADAMSQWAWSDSPSPRLPTTVEELKRFPFLLWQIPELDRIQVRSERIRWLSMQETIEWLRRSLGEEEFLLLVDPEYPAGNRDSGAITACRRFLDAENPNRLLMGGAVHQHPYRDDDGPKSMRVAYWSTVWWQLEKAVWAYAYIHQKLPAARKDLEEIMGPENPAAWNPGVQWVVEALLPQFRLEMAP